MKGKSCDDYGLRILSSSPVPRDPLKSRGFEATRLGFSPHYSRPRPVGVKETIEAVGHEDHTQDPAKVFHHREREVTNSNGNVHFPHPQQRSFHTER